MEEPYTITEQTGMYSNEEAVCVIRKFKSGCVDLFDQLKEEIENRWMI